MQRHGGLYAKRSEARKGQKPQHSRKTTQSSRRHTSQTKKKTESDGGQRGFEDRHALLVSSRRRVLVPATPPPSTYTSKVLFLVRLRRKMHAGTSDSRKDGADFAGR
eukprot:2667976-Pleurochrysis_carterae.AAC.2